MSLLPCLYCNGGSPTMLYRGGRRRNYYKSFTEENNSSKAILCTFLKNKEENGYDMHGSRGGHGTD